MSRITLKFTVRRVYGRLLAYPADRAASRFVEAWGCLTLTPGQIEALRGIGVAVVLLAEELKA